MPREIVGQVARVSWQAVFKVMLAQISDHGPVITIQADALVLGQLPGFFTVPVLVV